MNNNQLKSFLRFPSFKTLPLLQTLLLDFPQNLPSLLPFPFPSISSPFSFHLSTTFRSVLQQPFHSNFNLVFTHLYLPTHLSLTSNPPLNSSLTSRKDSLFKPIHHRLPWLVPWLLGAGYEDMPSNKRKEHFVEDDKDSSKKLKGEQNDLIETSVFQQDQNVRLIQVITVNRF